MFTILTPRSDYFSPLIGGEITQLALTLGHTDLKVTGRYIHFSPNYLDSASEKVRF